VKAWLPALKQDPRWMFAGLLTAFAVAGQVYLGFFQDWRKAAAAVGTAVVTELVLGRLRHRKWVNPLSAYITGTGLSLLLSSPVVWTYAAGAFLSVGSKYVLRYRGRHIYNPNNFGLVLLLLAFPGLAVSTPKQWTSALAVMVCILVLGLYVAWRVGRLDVVLAFGLGFFATGLIRHATLGTPMLAAIGPGLGASLQLFTLFMITDPKTSPDTREGRILFGMIVAALDACIRILRIPNAPFLALFLACTFANTVMVYLAERRGRSVPAA
jgi:enediyne biosynthesis protein E5